MPMIPKFQTLFVAALCLPTVAWGQGKAGGNAGGGRPGTGPTVVQSGAAPRKAVPHEDYYASFAPFYAGEYRSAMTAFQSAAKGGIRSTDGRWVDSICYHTMIGECYFQQGNLADALDQYNSALNIFVAYQDWMLRVTFPQNLGPQIGNMKNPVNWGSTSRPVTVGRYETTYLALQGRLDNQQVAQQGGVLSDPQLFPLNVVEIQRCIVVSLRRRAQLMGPVCPHDPLTQQLVAACSRKLTIPGHWTQGWMNLQLGMALLGTGKAAQAASELEQGLLCDGQFEHPFSSFALLELGNIALLGGKFEMAISYFLEATYSAAAFSQLDIMEEAFRGAVTAYLAAGNRDIFAPLLPAIAWANRVSVPLRASLFTLLAENLAHVGETAKAAAALDDARREIGRHDLAAGFVGARLQYQLAKVNFQAGNLAVGSKALTNAMAFETNGGSLRLFQVGLADAAWANALVTERAADQLFAEVLREPTARDWALNPMESMATMLAPLLLPMEHWFELSVARNEPERAIEISDYIRRHRFFSSLPLGGRLMALRWILEAPEELLHQQALLQRRDLLAKYPRYAELSRNAAQIRSLIGKQPLLPEVEDNGKAYSERYDALAKVSAAQELALHEISLNRDASDLVFPPQLNLKQLRQRLAKNQLVLAFFNTSKYLVSFQIGLERLEFNEVQQAPKVRADLAEMLKKWALLERNRPIEWKELQSQEWSKVSRKLFPQLVKFSQPTDWDNFEELIIVPDGPLWYCPFEVFEVGQGDQRMSLREKYRIRYVPTISLAVGDPRRIKPGAKTAVVTGRMFPKDDLQLTRDAGERLAGSLPGVSRLPGKLPASSSLMSKFCGRLIVLHDLDDCDKMPYDWSPGQVDKGRPGSSLASWMPLPWGAPEQLLLPGFHTAAESAMRKGGSGDEIFLTLCGLMSAGTRTILLSRWRVGGQTTLDLVQEFAQELPHMSATKAWQRSVQLRMAAELDPEKEPRVKITTPQSLNPEHPFFWAGYLLVDTGVEPSEEKVGDDAIPEKEDAPVVEGVPGKKGDPGKAGEPGNKGGFDADRLEPQNLENEAPRRPVSPRAPSPRAPSPRAPRSR